MNKNDERKFMDVVQSIVQSEADVDKILEAAKLNRNERPDNRLSAEQKMELIQGGMLLFGLMALFAAFILLMYVLIH